MKKLIIIAMIIIPLTYADSADLKSWRDTPLFCSKVEENHLPCGSYTLVRSYRNFTQLLVALDTKLVLYTDRDNRKDSDIFVSAYSCTDEIHLVVPSMQQHEFNIAIEKCIKQGDNGTGATNPFPGGDKFIEEIRKGIKPYKEDGECFIYIKENNTPVAIMTINQLWKKLTLRSRANEKKSPVDILQYLH